MQRRMHPRVRLRLPARLRWSAPLGQKTEQCESINVSRGGLLLSCNDVPGEGHPLWVTFPFDSAASSAQPETLARVVRRSKSHEEISASAGGRWKAALQLEATAHLQARGNGGWKADANGNGAGNKIALPIHVRLEHIPWPEEAMTVEVEQDKLKFLTNREYILGQRLLISFVSGREAPWNGEGEWETRVTEIEMERGKESMYVTVRKNAS
jgi:hypothetical protein